MEQEAIMMSVDDIAVPLKQVSIVARLVDLLSIIEVTQTYRNDGTRDIEAVYTFPLPTDAVLLDLELAIGECRLRGTVMEKSKAAEDYERAIETGHSALMLEYADDGIYTLSLGNLKAGEEAVVKFRYGLIGCWNGDEYAFRLPTTLAPRYGDPGDIGLAPHQAPQHSLVTHYPFSLRMEAFGLLHGAVIRSHSHSLAQQRMQDRTIITLAQTAALDRDLVVSFTVAEKISALAYYAPDDERHAAWASFRPQLAGTSPVVSPRSLRLIIDCSGSMGGDSIAQAKAALLEIMGRLIPDDRFNITAFGSSCKHLFNQEAAANVVNLAIARNWIVNLGADMGGTEMADAVEAACHLEAEYAERDVLLLTDGEVWDNDRIARAASKDNWRIFAVGVGSAPAESVLRKIAQDTGGAVELVTPGEDMSRRIVRHFERLREPQAAGHIKWPANTLWPYKAESIRCFHNDTVNGFAVIANSQMDGVELICVQPEGEQRFFAKLEAAPAEIAADLSRIVAAQWLKRAREKRATEIALRYQLMSKYTNYLVVLERAADEAGDGMPELHVAPQMLAAGWGGVGAMEDVLYDTPVFLRKSIDHTASPLYRDLSIHNRHVSDSKPSLREGVAEKIRDIIGDPKKTVDGFLRVFARMCKTQGHALDLAAIQVDQLRKMAPAELCLLIDELVAEGHDERQIWIVVALLLANLASTANGPEPGMMLLLDSASQHIPSLAEVSNRLAGVVGGKVGDEWRQPDSIQHGTRHQRILRALSQ